jgi:hypothetical protein
MRLVIFSTPFRGLPFRLSLVPSGATNHVTHFRLFTVSLPDQIGILLVRSVLNHGAPQRTKKSQVHFCLVKWQSIILTACATMRTLLCLLSTHVPVLYLHVLSY